MVQIIRRASHFLLFVAKTLLTLRYLSIIYYLKNRLGSKLFGLAYRSHYFKLVYLLPIYNFREFTQLTPRCFSKSACFNH